MNTNIKIFILCCTVQYCIWTQYLGSFCMNYWINAEWNGGENPVSLLRC